MDTKNLIMWVIIAILAIAVIYIGFFQGSASSSAISASNTAASAQSSYGGMVGGC